ncbi:uncharacterized protein EV422DRAFT_600759 [Fimicolochytrium jonesii]|uniref:uncharacterized protein n=1 Tax=Fimicolochytrium jonesii TaxID=1396493 RepID=UPI0022FF3569|nr:uncharacterized protein EV422DRAFT_600759 [Fimicolochytrium jonesii]KAI8825964.1 hypothetical protein EV422DRAFT_600759 [Fimicolochytrium jonesii]
MPTSLQLQMNSTTNPSAIKALYNSITFICIGPLLQDVPEVDVSVPFTGEGNDTDFVELMHGFRDPQAGEKKPLFLQAMASTGLAAPARFSDAGTMSRQELRARLFDTLRSAGVADKLKSQLRAKIVAELKMRVHANPPSLPPAHGLAHPKAFGNPLYADPSLQQPSGRLLYQVLDNLVQGYLKHRGFDFTLSVFLPESGFVGSSSSGILSDEDVMQALHLDQRTPFYRQLRDLMEQPSNRLHDHSRTENKAALLVNLIASLVRLGDLQPVSQSTQTDHSPLDTLEYRLKDADKHAEMKSQHQTKLHTLALEERMLRYQQDLDARTNREMEQRLTEFRGVELVQMRMEERKRYEAEIKTLQAGFERQKAELQERVFVAVEEERMRMAEREKQITEQNTALRQRLLEESNIAVMKETTLRTQADLAAQQVRLERDALQRRCDEAQREVESLRGLRVVFEERVKGYGKHSSEEHHQNSTTIEIERARLDADRRHLQEKLDQHNREMIHARTDAEDARKQLAEARELIRGLQVQKGGAVEEGKVLTDLQPNMVSLRAELQKITREHTKAEKAALQRKEEVKKELAKYRRSEQRWQRECQGLVMKLDAEINRNEHLTRKNEEKTLTVKQMRRETAELRLLLHHTREALDSKSLPDAYPPITTTLINHRSHPEIDSYALDFTYDTFRPLTAPSLTFDTHRDPHRRVVPNVEDVLTRASSPRRGLSPQRGGGEGGRWGEAYVPRLDSEVVARIDAGALGLVVFDGGDGGVGKGLDAVEGVRGGSDAVRDDGGVRAATVAPSSRLTTMDADDVGVSRLGTSLKQSADIRNQEEDTQRRKREDVARREREEAAAADQRRNEADVHQKQRQQEQERQEQELDRQKLESEAAAQTLAFEAQSRAAEEAAANEREERTRLALEAEAEQKRAREQAEAEKEERDRLSRLALESAQIAKRLARQQELDELDRKERAREREWGERERRAAGGVGAVGSGGRGSAGGVGRGDVEDNRRQAGGDDATTPTKDDQPQPQPIPKESETDRKLAEAEQDPDLQRFVEMVKRRRAENAAAAAPASASGDTGGGGGAAAAGTQKEKAGPLSADMGGDTKPVASSSVKGQVEDFMKAIDASSASALLSSTRSSISGLGFGVGDTEDEVSAPVFDETSDDEDPW